MLIESIPNLSEGRRPSVVRALVDAVTSQPGVVVLDHSSDSEHHRSVITLAGSSSVVTNAILRLFEAAVEAIDLRLHHGEHPRVGAVDVVPFVPLEGATMTDCVQLAQQVGQMVADRFAIPVFLYENAARTAERRRLEQIRRGGLDALAARMASGAWPPDFGPKAPHPSAGVTVIGARGPLIAFNVNLRTARRDIAPTIAMTIRESGGGLPSLKAIGLYLADRGVAQVSMNLTDFHRTSLLQAFDAVQHLAAEHGVEVANSELIGLVPAAAVAGVEPARIAYPGDLTDRILERRLAIGLTQTP